MPVTDYTPTLAQVGAATLQRTKDKYGNVTGTFSVNTTPTNTQVNELITKAVDKVALKTANDIPSILFESAQEVVAERVAMLIETTFFPEQINDNRSPYAIIKEQFDEDIKDLQLAVQSVEAGDDLGMGNQPETHPNFSFPAPGITLDRRM